MKIEHQDRFVDGTALAGPPTEGASAFRVMPLARIAYGGRWRTEAMRSYAQPLLLWFLRGQGRITISGVTHGYGAHHLVYLPAGTMHGFEMAGQVVGSAVYLPADLDLGMPEDPVHLSFRDAQQHGALNQMIEYLQREVEADLPGRERALVHHAGLISVWLERELETNPGIALYGDASRRIAAAFTALVEQEFRTGKSVNDYAAALGVTPTHLTRACNTACGRPASAILADRVHYEARRLLAETGRPIKDIAAGLGFTSAAYFTRAFQKHTGLTPSAFRQGH